jgi:hypothetical protein
MSLAEDFLTEADSGSRHFMEPYCRAVRARIRLANGDLDAALEDTARALDQARASNQPQMLCPALAVRARVLAAAGNLDEAAAAVDELLELWTAKLGLFLASSWVVDLTYALDALGRSEGLRAVAESVRARTAWLEAANAFASGEFAIAADCFAAIGSRPDEAQARLRSAQALARAGLEADARVELERALAFFGSVEATGYLRDAEALASA